MRHLKNLIDHNMENEKLKNAKTLEQLKENFQQIMNTVSIEEEYQRLNQILTTYLEEKNYNKLLELCNLKWTITKDVARKTINGDYIDIAVNEITRNKALQEELKSNYFTDIL
ncbi:hypothetical protein ABY69_02923 [Listeria monocytogenes]|nr:hypothetical protein ABY69_02923 [Listeria monocytogenes]